MNKLQLKPSLAGPPWTKATSLAKWRSQLVCMEVGEGGVASVFCDQQHVATLFSACHWVYVLGENEDRGDFRLAEAAERSGLEGVDLDAIASRIHYFDHRCEIILFDTRPLPLWEIDEGRPVLVRAHVQSPGRFYASFLRNTESLEEMQFHRVSRALVADCLRRAEAEGAAPTDIVRRGLTEVGMALEELEFTPHLHAEHPDSSASVPEESQVSTPSPPLATSTPRG